MKDVGDEYKIKQDMISIRPPS